MTTIALQIAGPPRAWHRWIADRLADAGHDTIMCSLGETQLPVEARLTLAVETALYRGHCAALAPTGARADSREAPDLVLVLDGVVSRSERALTVTFDGKPGMKTLFAALLRGRAPTIALRAADTVYAAGLPALEDPLRLHRSLDAVLMRVAVLVAQGVDAFLAGRRLASMPSKPLAGFGSAPLAWRELRGKLVRRFGAARGRPAHWRIVMRKAGPEPIGSGTILPDDGRRFYADPFLWNDGGRRLLFFEDYPYATGKGVIGMVELDGSGAPGAPRMVLEESVHLSYPFLWEEGGTIYMLPEMSAARRLQLFRADPFPDRWVPDRILIEGVALSDATVVRRNGLYWIFATLSGPIDSTWDQLVLYHAPALAGPWTAHPRNPVLIDAGAARPAGAMWHEGGRLMRVAQDCRARYGAGLAICRVDRLDADGYAQTVVRRIEAPAAGGAFGIHTWNRAGDMEVIDLSVPHGARG